RRLGAQLDGDAVATALALVSEVDGEHVIERRIVGMVVIDVGGVDPHPALTPFGAADQRRLFDDVRAHRILLCWRARLFGGDTGRRSRKSAVEEVEYLRPTVHGLLGPIGVAHVVEEGVAGAIIAMKLVVL